MRRYILDAPLTPPKDTSDAPARLLAFVKACKEIIADGKITLEEAEALRRWLSAAGWLKHFWPANAIAVRINRLLEPVPTEQQLQDLGTFLSQIVEQSNFDESPEQEELLDDPELWNRGVQDWESLEGADRQRFQACALQLFHIFEEMYYQRLERHLDPRLWRETETSMRDLINVWPGIRAWLRDYSRWFSEEFANYLIQLQQIENPDQ